MGDASLGPTTERTMVAGTELQERLPIAVVRPPQELERRLGVEARSQPMAG